MKMHRTRPALAIGASLVLLGGSAFLTSQAQAAPLPTDSHLAATAAAEDDIPKATFQELRFAHPVSLESAVTVVEGAGVAISGYHFESDSITGDFWPGSGLSVEEFLAEIEVKTATAPEVVGAYVDADMYAESVKTSRNATPPVLGESLPVFDAPDADPSLAAIDADEESSESSPKIAAGDTWHPTTAEVMIGSMADNLSISAKYHWTGSNPFASPLVMADHWGMEFQVDSSAP